MKLFYLILLPLLFLGETGFAQNFKISEPGFFISGGISQTGNQNHAVIGEIFGSGSANDDFKNRNNNFGGFILPCTFKKAPNISLNNSTFSSSTTGGTYNWMKVGLAGSQGNQMTFSPLSNGLYFLSFTYDNGCQLNSDTLEINTVGLANLNTFDWQVFPNPSKGYFQISGNWASNEVLNLSLINIQGGSVLWEQQLQKSDSRMLDFGFLPKGIYLLNIRGQGQQKSLKIILF